MEKAKRIIPAVCGIVGLAVGCIAAYFVLSTLWTRFIIHPSEVAEHDLYIVLTLSMIAGVVTGLLALLMTAQRYWNPRAGTLHRHVS